MQDVPDEIVARPTINPYRSGLQAIVQRLRWDLNPASWSSRKQLRHWKDRYPRAKAVIVCNGPSLLRTPLEQLSGVFCFGLNKINLLFPKTSFRPNAIVAINALVLEQNAAFFRETDIPLFLASEGYRHVGRRPQTAYLHVYETWKLAQDCSVSINPGATVTTTALQLAFHCGFRDVALVGCDHNFADKGPANATVTAKGEDRSHFDPNYFGKGVQWQLPDLPASEYYYSMARRMFEAAGGRVVNCTEGGKLEVFQRMPTCQWLGEVQTAHENG